MPNHTTAHQDTIIDKAAVASERVNEAIRSLQVEIDDIDLPETIGELLNTITELDIKISARDREIEELNQEIEELRSNLQ